MEKEKLEDSKLGFLLESLNNRIKAGIPIIPTFEIELPGPNKYGYIPKNNCKSKKELRAWIQLQNKRKKAEV